MELPITGSKERKKMDNSKKVKDAIGGISEGVKSFVNDTVDMSFDFDKTGVFGFKLIVYLALANIMFMGGFSTCLVVLFAIVAIAEKDSSLTKVVLSMLATLVVLNVALGVWDLAYTPVKELLRMFTSNVKFDGVLYHIGDFLQDVLHLFNTAASWIYHAALIFMGAANMKKLQNGTYKVSKYIAKYF